jgi:hypothetical protein
VTFRTSKVRAPGAYSSHDFFRSSLFPLSRHSPPSGGFSFGRDILANFERFQSSSVAAITSVVAGIDARSLNEMFATEPGPKPFFSTPESAPTWKALCL